MPKKTRLALKRKKRQPSRLAFQRKEPQSPTQNFRNVVQWLLQLHQEEQIDDDQLEALLVYACSLFIEQEVDRRIENILSDKLSEQLSEKFSLDALLEAL